MKLFIAAHFLILSFAALGFGVWKDKLVIGGVLFVVFQALAFYVMFKNRNQGADNV